MEPLNRQASFVSHLIAVLLALVFSPSAEAQQSKFQVSAMRSVPGGYDVDITYEQPTRAMTAQLFALAQTPQNRVPDRGEIPFAQVDLPAGQGTVTVHLPNEAAEATGVRPGETIHFAAHWPATGHVWGIQGRANGTSAPFPPRGGSSSGTATDPQDHRDKGMPLVWSRRLWRGAREAKDGAPEERGSAMSSLGKSANIGALPVAGRNLAEAGTLLESEAKVSIRNKRQLRRAIGLLNAIAQDSTLAEKVLGPGWSVAKTAEYTFEDSYQDDASLSLAQGEGGVRVRSVKKAGAQVGQSQLNVKATGGLRTGPEEVVMSRIEGFLTLGPSADLAAVRTDIDPANPFRLVNQSAAPVGEVVNQKARRTRYQLLYRDAAKSGTPPQAVADISVDNVFDFQPKAAPRTPTEKKRATFFGFEVDIAHMSVDGSGAQVDYIPGVQNWSGPHRPVDLPLLQSDASIQKTYAAIGNLVEHLANHGIEMKAAVPKYTEGMIRTGRIKPRDNTHQARVLRRDPSAFIKAKNPNRPRARQAAGAK